MGTGRPREHPRLHRPLQRQRRQRSHRRDGRGVRARRRSWRRAAVATRAATRSTTFMSSVVDRGARPRTRRQRVGDHDADRRTGSRHGPVPFIRHFTATTQIDVLSETHGEGAFVLPLPDRARPRPLGPVPRRVRAGRREVAASPTAGDHRRRVRGRVGPPVRGWRRCVDARHPHRVVLSAAVDVPA